MTYPPRMLGCFSFWLCSCYFNTWLKSKLLLLYDGEGERSYVLISLKIFLCYIHWLSFEFYQELKNVILFPRTHNPKLYTAIKFAIGMRHSLSSYFVPVLRVHFAVT